MQLKEIEACEAEATFLELLTEVENGSEFIITQDGERVAIIKSYQESLEKHG